MFDKLKDIAIRYEELEGLLSSSEVVGKQGLYQRYAKEHADLRLLVETFKDYEDTKRRIEEGQEILHGADEHTIAVMKWHT